MSIYVKMNSAILLSVLIFSSPLFCQQNRLSADNSVIAAIEQSYNDFNYAETDRLLTLALAEINNYTIAQRIIINKIAAFRRFQENRPLAAEDFFWKVLEIDPTYSLDPVNTPPKLLTLFDKVKVDYLSTLQNQSRELQQQILQRPRAWRSLIFPGWEQLHRGHRIKGFAWMAAGITVIGGTVNSVLVTESRRDEYLTETDPALATEKYNRFNTAYRSQYYWSYALAGVWLSSHLDALFFSDTPLSLELSIQPNQPQLGMRINF